MNNPTMRRLFAFWITAATLMGLVLVASCTSNGGTATAAPAAAHATAASSNTASPAPASPGAATSDGLVLVKNTELGRVYVRPGATLKPYTKFAILNCMVSFAPNWREDMQTNFSLQITQEQVQQTEAAIAAEFKDVFVTQLEQGGFPMVTTAAPDVLVLRPALINVYITAPQNLADPDSATFSSTTGQLTLFLELYDSVTSKLLARVIDPESVSATDGTFMWQSRAGNITAGRDAMTRWADILRQRMEAARSAQ
ncbi:MAG TPA: DUF3313 family protein [Pseudomonadales bacterium]|nr:DUF3313 family protein [Pseudomonadales bacterium]